MRVMVREDEAQEKEATAANIQAATTQLVETEQKLDKLLEAFLNNQVDQETYQNKKNQLLYLKLDLKDKLTELNSGVSAWIEIVKHFIKLAVASREIAREKNNQHQLARMLKKVGSKYLLSGRKIQFIPDFPFKTLAEWGGSASVFEKRSLMLAFGQSKYYVDSLSENTKRGLRQKVRRGEYPGLAPVGYLNDVRAKTIIVNRKRSKIIRSAFELYSQGNSTLGDISNFLAQRGIKTRGDKPFKRDKISFILSNPFYYGYFRYAGELHEGKHEPIITKKLFDKVQEVLKQRSKPQRKEKIPKAFTGLFHCGECGMMITAEIQKSHVYYRCTKKSKTKTCHQSYIREEDLGQQLSSMIQKVSLHQGWAKQMLKMLEKEKANSAQSCFAFVQENRKKLQELKRKLQFLLDSYLDQVIEREIYLEKKSEIMSQVKTLEEQNIRFEQKQNDWLEPMRVWINEAVNAAKIARDNDLFTKKVLALKIFGSNLVIENKKARGSAQNQWAVLSPNPRSLTVVPPGGVEPSIFRSGT